MIFTLIRETLFDKTVNSIFNFYYDKTSEIL